MTSSSAASSSSDSDLSRRIPPRRGKIKARIFSSLLKSVKSAPFWTGSSSGTRATATTANDGYPSSSSSSTTVTTPDRQC